MSDSLNNYILLVVKTTITKPALTIRILIAFGQSIPVYIVPFFISTVLLVWLFGSI